MATVAEVQALILGDLHRTDITAQVATAMTNAIDKLRMERLYFNEGTASFTATLTADYALTTVLPRILEIDTMAVSYNGEPSDILRTHWMDLQGYNTATSTGCPHSWAVHHRLLRLYPTPNQTSTVEVTGLLELSLTAWCSSAPTLIRATAEVELYALVTHDMAGAQRAGEVVRLELDSLRRRLPTFAPDGETRPYL